MTTMVIRADRGRVDGRAADLNYDAVLSTFHSHERIVLRDELLF